MAKSKYDPETFPALAEGYAREGLIDKELAAKLGGGGGCFHERLKRHSEFSESIKRGKTPVDFAVEGALLRLPPAAPGGSATFTGGQRPEPRGGDKCSALDHGILRSPFWGEVAEAMRFG